MRYVFPVLWMTSCWSISPNGGISRRRRRAHRDEVCCPDSLVYPAVGSQSDITFSVHAFSVVCHRYSGFFLVKFGRVVFDICEK